MSDKMTQNHPHDFDEHSGHAHGLTHGGAIRQVSDSRLLWAIALNQLLTIGQVVAGVLSGSVALLGDAAHNFGDANALLIAFIARRVSRKGANKRYTFGYRRAELIGAMINLTLLAVVGLYLVYEAAMQLFQPHEITGWLMASTAALALVVDVGTAWLLWAMSRGSLNVRAAFVHNLVDALGSIGVLIAAAAIIWLDWTWTDTAMTLLISGYVLWQVYLMLPQAIAILMEGGPDDVELDKLIRAVEAVEGVEHMHHVHLWKLDEQHRALEAHITVCSQRMSQMEAIKGHIKQRLADEFDIQHSTLEFEHPHESADPNHDSAVISVH